MRHRTSTFQRSRRIVVQSVIGAVLSFPLLGSAFAADDGLNFSAAVDSVSGPFKSIADKLAREARGRIGKGGEAQLLLEDYLVRGDKKAPAIIHSMAKKGDDKARTVLGYMFDNGIGAVKNPTRAIDNFALAAYKDELARYNLGVMTLNGRGVPADPEKAMTYFMQIRRVPYAFVPMALHAMDKGQGAIALEMAYEAHKLKDVYGTYLYARLLLEKGEDANGARMMQNAANAGVQEAIDSMVYIYEHGVGMPVNNGMAIGWWIIAQVADGKATLEQALESAERFNLSKSDLGVARRFSSKWLINYVPIEPFDYTKTLTYSDLERTR